MPMPNSRRAFLQSAMTAGLARTIGAAAPGSSEPEASFDLPKMKFFSAEITRLVLGTNPFYGYSHYNQTYSAMMRQYYTPEKVCAVLHQAVRCGINAFNYVHLGRAPEDWARFRSEGGRMHLIAQCLGDAADVQKTVQPLAIYKQGEVVDKAFQKGDMKPIQEWTKAARDLGMVVGVGTHKPEVIAYCEEHGWDVDFYAGCVYNRTRTAEEWKQVLHGESLEMPQEIYLRSDPSRMYKVMRQTSKPCFAFKILAAGRLSDQEMDHAYQTAFESLKPIDGVFVGMFPRIKDEIQENVVRAHRVLVRG